MTFEEYLHSKRIDSHLFLKNEKNLWQSWKMEFDLINPKSFTAQKLYLINPIRRKYPLAEKKSESQVDKEEVKTSTSVRPKAVFKPKFK